MKVKFFDLTKQYNQIKNEVEKSTIEILLSGNYVSGRKVKEFEEKFAEYCGVKYCCAVNTGTAALDLAIKFFNFPPSSFAFTQPNSFIATTEALLYNYIQPDFLDIDGNGLINYKNYNKKFTFERHACNLPVNLYGNPFDTRKIVDNMFPIILDACQSHGALIDGQKIATLANVTCFSFYPGKNLGACGEGGALVTNNKDLYEFAIMMRSHGQPQKYHHDLIGYNYRMDEIQANILTIKLKYLEEWTEQRIEKAKRYNKNFQGSNVRFLDIDPKNRCVYHLYPVFIKHRNLIAATLSLADIETGIHYPIPIHLQKATQSFGYKKGDFPNAEQQADEELSLPLYPEITNDEIDYVCETLLKVL